MTITTVCDELADAIFELGYPVSHVEVKIDTPYRHGGPGRCRPGRGRIGIYATVTWEYTNILASEPAPESSILCTTSNLVESDSKISWGIISAGPGIFHLIGLRTKA